MNIHSFRLVFSDGRPERVPAASFSFYFDGAPLDKVSCVISGRAAGNMALAAGSRAAAGAGENPAAFSSPARQALFESLGLDYLRVSFLEQIHSREVLETGAANLLRGIPGDGLVSARGDIVLSVTVADCLPVFLYDTESGALGLLHSGWKGTGIVLNALSLMSEKWGTRPEAVAAVLGPCIRSCCYRVDGERAASYKKEFALPRPGGNPAFTPSGTAPFFGPPAVERDGGFFLDMQAANIGLLAASGVRNIAVCEDCTFTDERLGSFRREGRSYTRMLALCGYFEAPAV